MTTGPTWAPTGPNCLDWSREPTGPTGPLKRPLWEGPVRVFAPGHVRARSRRSTWGAWRRALGRFFCSSCGVPEPSSPPQVARCGIPTTRRKRTVAPIPWKGSGSFGVAGGYALTGKTIPPTPYPRCVGCA